MRRVIGETRHASRERVWRRSQLTCVLAHGVAQLTSAIVDGVALAPAQQGARSDHREETQSPMGIKQSFRGYPDSGAASRSPRLRSRLTVGAAVVGLVALLLPFSAGIASASLVDGNVSLTVLSPAPGQVITGPTLPLQVTASGYRIDARYAGTPNLPYVGHYHEIIDGKLIDMTPYQDGNRDTISMVGLTPGAHVLTIVPARNDHSMIMSAAVMVPFTYAGPYLPEPPGYTGTGNPGITITAPAANSTVTGSSFSVSVDATNFVLCGTCFGKDLVAGEGHWHVFLDTPMVNGMPNMAAMVTMGGGIGTMSTQTISLKAVTSGWHTFWALLVNNDHMPLMDPTTGMLLPGTMTSVRVYATP